MKPVDQTTFGNPGGNCFSACIASLLHLPIGDVPYFMSNDPQSSAWIPKLTAWLKPFGLYPLMLSANAFVPGYHILQGVSPRREGGNVGGHAVIGQGDVCVHDPHPSKAGIRAVKGKIVLVPYEPMLRMQ